MDRRWFAIDFQLGGAVQPVLPGSLFT